MTNLPSGDFNLPPGVSIRDIDRQCQETEQPPNCPGCDGEGIVIAQKESEDGTFYELEETCPTCHGMGFQT